MHAAQREILGQQIEATIDMLENAMAACPDTLWSDPSRQPEFWYLAFHTLFFLDLYLSESLETFSPPAPFTLDELDPAGIHPTRPYTKRELGAYLARCRAKCRDMIAALTDEALAARREFASIDCTLFELLLYVMRHNQHHAAQLNLLLRQTTGSAPRWVSRGKRA